MSFVATEKIHLEVFGIGLTSYEPAEIETIEDGVMTLVNSEREYDAITGKTLEASDFGFVFTVRKGPAPQQR